MFLSFIFPDLSYKFILEQQPIGRQLFREFCRTKTELQRATNFLDSVVSIDNHKLNPLNPGHFYEFRKFIKISPVGITKWYNIIQEESHQTDGKTYKFTHQKHRFWA
jgi:hypothetical protein